VSVSLRYGAAAAAVVALLTLVMWPFLGPPARRGVLVAGSVALPVQVIAFSLLARYRGQANGFIAAWAGGMAIRALVIGGVALFLIRSGGESAVSMLLALAGFFFVLLLLEPVYFRHRPTEPA